MEKHIVENPALTSQALAFDPVLPRSTEAGFNPPMDAAHYIPTGAEVREDGSIDLSFYAPKASDVSVQVGIDGPIVQLNRQDNGVWTGNSRPGGKGFINLDFFVDGNLVLDPLAPIGFGSSNPINFVNVPEDDCEFLLCEDVPHGSISHEYFKSSVTGRTESCLVYLPAQYHERPDVRYPVLYLQHGHGENENCWVTQGKMNFILDNLIAAGKAQPMIVVMNNGMVQIDGSVDSTAMAMVFERFLLQDVIPFVESRFRTRTDRLGRGMAGLSMGSIQTSWATFRHLDMFAYIGLFSGFMSHPRGISEDSHHAVLEDAEYFNKNAEVFFRAIGDKDFAIDIFEKDTGICENKGINNTIKIYDGYHEWKVWRECFRDFTQLIFKQ